MSGSNDRSSQTTRMTVWRCYGEHPLPSPAEALAAPLQAFPSWYLRMVCQCGQERFLSETHLSLAGRGDQCVAHVVARLRHERCGGSPATVELVTGIPGVSNGMVRRIGLTGDG
jgi:hypothetical protein